MALSLSCSCRKAASFNKLLKFTPPAKAGSVGLARGASPLAKR
ncbi:hypothetical protein [Shewanella xiamenensis]|nr:hypothetical protein [Shewanella xiamenensis]